MQVPREYPYDNLAEELPGIQGAVGPRFGGK
jgi:hypothetical protein